MNLLSAHHITHGYQARSGIGARSRKNIVLEDVSLAIAPGETVALLGRSGCGKSTLARLLVGLENPDSGEVEFEGQPMRRLDKAGRARLYRTVQMVFQDPPGAVNPRATVGEIVGEPLGPLCGLRGDDARARVMELLRAVQLSEDDYGKYPQQMSGGQLQRVCIARALGPDPKLIILDEAVSNLDLHLQTQMLDLFAALRQEHGVSYLFVTHDLRLVERFCSRLVVMAQGRIVEESAVAQPLALRSPEGRALARAVLPPFPRARPAHAEGSLLPVGA
ncbi:MAG: nickel import ATP-binding protein NikE [Pigmentiphaga sp.]